MSLSREQLKQELDQLSDIQLQQIAEFVAFLKFRDRQINKSWKLLIESLDYFSEDFISTREQPPLEIREMLE